MTLIKEGIITSVILIIIGIGGYIAGGAASVTALIPAIFGVLIFISALVAKKNLKAGMHMAAFFGLLGFIAPLGRLIPSAIKDGITVNLPFLSQLSMVIICGIFVALCVRSFIIIRKNRQNS